MTPLLLITALRAITGRETVGRGGTRRQAGCWVIHFARLHCRFGQPAKTNQHTTPIDNYHSPKLISDVCIKRRMTARGTGKAQGREWRSSEDAVLLPGFSCAARLFNDDGYGDTVYDGGICGKCIPWERCFSGNALWRRERGFLRTTITYTLVRRGMRYTGYDSNQILVSL